MFRIGVAIFISLSLLTQVVCAEQNSSLDRICQLMVKEGVLISSFTQKKTITGLPVPLISSGNLVVKNGMGIIWQTQKPFPVTLLLNDQGIFQMENLKKTNMTNGQRQDKNILNILSKLLKGDFKNITEFNVMVLDGSTDDNWKIELSALGSLAKFISKIKIKGDTYIREISIQRNSGDIDVITLTNPRIEKMVPAAFRKILTN